MANNNNNDDGEEEEGGGDDSDDDEDVDREVLCISKAPKVIQVVHQEQFKIMFPWQNDSRPCCTSAG